jgi:3-oxoadipate enol-lactonase
MERKVIERGGAAIEVILEARGAGAIVAAAHPADPFTDGTVALLRKASGAGVVCVNPRGLGGSAARPRGYELEAMVDDVERARRALRLEPWVFWGMSGGGWLGELYARKYPEALAGLVLESTCACFRVRLGDPACVLSPFFPAWAGPLEAAGLLDPDAHARPGDPDDTEWTEVPQVGSVFRRRGGPALLVSPLPISTVMRQSMPALWAFDARPWLRDVRTPTLVIAGAADPVVPLAHARAVHEAIPGSRFLAIDGAAHVPVSEGRPEVTTAVRAFLGSLR